MIKNAKQVGTKFAASFFKADENAEIEDVILEAMAENPYKAENKRQDFINGVSEWANMIGRIRTRKAVYGNQNLSKYGY